MNVYGVEIPGGDGRACMAAIIAADNLDFKGTLSLFAIQDDRSASPLELLGSAGLYAHCAKVLPPYAVPLFLRKLPKIDVTGA